MSDLPPLRPAPSRGGVAVPAVLGAIAVGALGAWAGGARDAGRSAAAAAALLATGAALLFAPSARRLTAVERLFVVVGCLACLQCVPWPAPVAHVLAPAAARAREESLGTAGASPVTHDLAATARTALLLFALAGFASAMRRTAAGGGAFTLARCLALVLLAHGAVALRHGDYGEDDRLLGGESVGNALNAWGTFVNRAHFAGYAVILLGPAFALWRGPRPWLDRPLSLVSTAVGLAAVLLSGSRGGIAGAALAAAAAFVVLVPRRARAVAVALVVVAGGAVVAARLAGVDALVRALPQRPGESKRFEVWKGSVDLALAQPVLGNGIDAFRWSYGGAGRPVADRWVSTAESDPLQAAAEGGVALVVLLGAAAVAGLRALRRDRPDAAPAARTASSLVLCGLVGAAPIALTSAPFHVPAVALAGVAAWALARALATPAPAAGDASGPAILARGEGGPS